MWILREEREAELDGREGVYQFERVTILHLFQRNRAVSQVKPLNECEYCFDGLLAFLVQEVDFTRVVSEKCVEARDNLLFALLDALV